MVFLFLNNSFLKTTITLISNNFPAFVKTTAGQKEKVTIFIDGSNLYHSFISSFGSPKINIEYFCKKISDDNKIVRINYYTAPLNKIDNPEAYKAQQKFLAKIQKTPKLFVVFGRMEKRGNTIVEKGVDVKLAVDLIIGATKNEFDTAILVSNDADFVPAIKAIQELGKKVVNITFPKRKSYHLNQTCNKTIEITKTNEYQEKTSF